MTNARKLVAVLMRKALSGRPTTIAESHHKEQPFKHISHQKNKMFGPSSNN